MMMENLKKEVKNFRPLKAACIVLAVILVTWIMTLTVMPAKGEELGAWSLMPAIFLILYIFATRRILESLTLSCIMSLIILKHSVNIVGEFSAELAEVMADGDMVWLIIVCGLMGSIIALIEKSGGAFAFGEWAAKKAKGGKSALMWTWVLGIVVFVDDYLNALTVGSCMASLTDKHKIPREMLSYVVDSTAAPLCVLIPISTWAIFAGRLLEVNGWAPEGEGLVYFIKTIPYNFYGWAAALIVPLVIFKIVPIFGPMKSAYKRVEEGGPLAPPGSDKIDVHGSEKIEIPENSRMINLLVPIFGLVGFTLYFDIDMQMGVICTMATIFVFYLAQGIMTAEDFADYTIKGLQNMILPLMLMVLAWLFAAVNEQIGFTQYVIDLVAAHATPALLPFGVFCALAVTEFITGTNWGMYIIALPIVIPLGLSMTPDSMPLTVGALLSAGVLGSHCCFYSDATVITSAACGCENFRHAFTQMPYGLLAGLISAVLFLIMGLISI